VVLQVPAAFKNFAHIGVLSDTLLCLEATQLERAGKLSNVFAAVPTKRHDVTSLMKQTLDPTLGED